MKQQRSTGSFTAYGPQSTPVLMNLGNEARFLTDGDTLAWDSTNGAFRNVAPGSGATVSTDTTLVGDGSSGNPLGLATDGVTPGTYTNPSSVTVDSFGRTTAISSGGVPLTSVTTDTSLTGAGTGGSPLGLPVQAGIPIGRGGGVFPLATVTFNNRGVATAASSGAVSTNATLSGTGQSGSPLSVVSAPTGSTGVARDATLTGNGTTGSPLSVVSSGTSLNSTVGLSVKYGNVVAASGANIILTNAGGAGTTWGTQKTPANFNAATGLYTVSVTGWYGVSSSVTFGGAVTAVGVRYVVMALNGVVQALDGHCAPAVSAAVVATVNGYIYLTAGNTLRFEYGHTQGANLNTVATASVVYLAA